MRSITCLVFCIGLFSVVMTNSTLAQEPVRLYAAGSLRAAMTEIGEAFNQSTGVLVHPEFGASGLLRERIEKGAKAEVFASADMGHPQTLAKAGRAKHVVLFTRNRLCALVTPKIDATSSNLLFTLLDTKTRVGTSTPVNDPSGDYTWAMFQKAEKLRPGAYAALSGKALKLVGGSDTPPPPADRSVYAMLMDQDKADIFITYCTGTIAAQRESPKLRIVQLPDALAVGADYGLTVLNGASENASGFALFVMSLRGQEILAKHGFTASGLP